MRYFFNCDKTALNPESERALEEVLSSSGELLKIENVGWVLSSPNDIDDLTPELIPIIGDRTSFLLIDMSYVLWKGTVTREEAVWINERQEDPENDDV